MTKAMLSIVGAILIFSLIFSLFGLYISVRPPRLHSPIQPSHLGLPYEEIALKTSDGLTLRGWFIPNRNSRKAIVALHGYPADKGDILPALSFLHSDFNLLLFDFRYFGDSEGSYSTAGAREVRDLLAALQYLQDRGFRQIGVWGFSMGGAVALMGSAKSDSILAIVAEASYADLHLMARETYRHLLILKYPLALLTGIWAKAFLGVDIREVSPAKAIQSSRLPILIIHSTKDDVIPFLHALRLKQVLQTNPRAEFWFTESLAHGQHLPGYEEKVKGFFLKHLGEGTQDQIP